MTEPTNPFSELLRAFDRLQDTFEEMANSWNGEALKSAASSITVDLEDRGEELVLTAELPGFDTDDIDIRATDRTLRLKAERAEESTEESEGAYIRRERHRASVSRSIPLPEVVETDDISATYNNGILTVRMPKSEPVTEGSEIEIE